MSVGIDDVGIGVVAVDADVGDDNDAVEAECVFVAMAAVISLASEGENWPFKWCPNAIKVYNVSKITR
jgi:hypothetical protein